MEHLFEFASFGAEEAAEEVSFASISLPRWVDGEVRFWRLREDMSFLGTEGIDHTICSLIFVFWGGGGLFYGI